MKMPGETYTKFGHKGKTSLQPIVMIIHCKRVWRAHGLHFVQQWSLALRTHAVRNIRVLDALCCVPMDIRNIGYMEQFDQVPTSSLQQESTDTVIDLVYSSICLV